VRDGCDKGSQQGAGEGMAAEHRGDPDV